MDEKLGDVLTIEELSIYLKIPKSTLYKLVWEGKVPDKILQEDPSLIMWYDQAVTRTGDES